MPFSVTVINVWTIDALKSKSQKKISTSMQSLDVQSNQARYSGSKSGQALTGHDGRYIPNPSAGNPGAGGSDNISLNSHISRPEHGHLVSKASRAKVTLHRHAAFGAFSTTLTNFCYCWPLVKTPSLTACPT